MITVARSLLLWLLLTSGIAFFWPAERLGLDPFAATPWLLWSLIVVTMLALGTLVRPEELRPVRSSPWWVILGVVTQVTVMPAAAWLVTRLVPMDAELAMGVILVGCVPGAMASNVLTSTARGAVAYSVSLTATATLLSPLTVPMVLWIVSSANAEHSLLGASMRLALLVVLPTVVGYTASRRFGRVADAAADFSSPIASMALLWIIATVVAANREKLSGVSGVLILALLAINIAGYFGGHVVGKLARLPPQYARALTLEVGMQNAGLGTALAVSLFGSETIATIPTAAYTFGCMLTGTMLAVWWRSRDEETGLRRAVAIR